MLSQQTVETVKATSALLQSQAHHITALFYQKLFAAHPELKHIFNIANQAKGEQQRALADSVIAYACHIDKLEALGPAVERIAHKHASLQVAPEHYPIVGQFLLAAIGEHLDLEQHDPVIQAWGEAYQALAAIFVNREAAIYQENEEKHGGWRGFRAFDIVEIVEEAKGIKSFYLKAADGEPVAIWQAGQYVGVKVNPPGSDYNEIRQYSLSNAPNNDVYRLTIRAEQNPEQPDGLVSNYLHDLAVGEQLLLQPPTGEFVLNNSNKAPVLLAGGVGITPVLSMLLDKINQGEDVSKLTFIFCCRDKEHHIKAQELKALQRLHGFEYYVSYEHGSDADFEGYLSEEILAKWIGDTTRQAYFCGPKPFMAAIDKALKNIGFSDECRFYESFGPKLAL